MAITLYTNFDSINKRIDSEGKYILDKDFNVISKNEIENVDFGECGTDVMEVSIYDINNNLLPQKSGQTVAYIKSGDIKNYLYKISRPNKALANGEAQLEIAIDAKKLLNDLGYENGILKLNINFVRNRVGTENKVRRAWIQEISPSRQEIRILPLKTNNRFFDDLNQKELTKLKNLNKDFKFYKKSILNSINKFENLFTNKVDDYIISKYGNDFLNLAKKDFGLKNFSDLKKAIIEDFKQSVEHYLSNRAYDISKTNFGLPTEVRFIDCEQYDFDPIIAEIQNILNNCVRYNLQFLKRREISVRNIPKEFKAVDLTPDIVNITNVIPPPVEQTTVYQPAESVIETPINNGKQTINIKPEKIIDTVIPPKPPTEIQVDSTGTFTYHIENKDSRSPAVFKFYDASGTSVQKILSPGSSAKICAKENTVSANGFVNTKLPDTFLNIFSKTALPKLNINTPFSRNYIETPSDRLDRSNFIIKKEEACSNVKIGSQAPTPTPDPPVRQTPPAPPVNSGGGTRGTFNLPVANSGNISRTFSGNGFGLQNKVPQR
jgi:hypothetical protein